MKYVVKCEHQNDNHWALFVNRPKQALPSTWSIEEKHLMLICITLYNKDPANRMTLKQISLEAKQSYTKDFDWR